MAFCKYCGKQINKGKACPECAAANEAAVAGFLAGKIGFYEIAEAVADALTLPSDPEPSLEDIIEADRSTRAYIRERYALA